MITDVRHSGPQWVKVNGIKIVYDSFGLPSASPLLLIAGLGDQMINWPERFCEQLAAQGYWVIRFDNRDAGLSTKFEQADVPGLLALVWAYVRGKALHVPYTLEDMAKDSAGLLAALGVESAHVVGGSLGGMIALMMATRHPRQVKTLTVLMSTAKDSRLSPPRPRALILFKSAPRDRAGYINHAVRVRRALSGRGFPFDEAHVRRQAGRLYDRSHNSAGASRQMAAIMASIRGLREELNAIDVPTLVVHGSDDPLLPVKHGVHTAQVIPGATLRIIEGLGHELPPAVWAQVVEAIRDHAV
jgi:pimeloyl-ACP methyl ester carboxylesterase